ncbi:hypothetical protein Leryth_003825 [Lithospermum erythrorhizon]|nr:hypothetical protein Leryth_003825 [Lithospermum erythrorhizon]
MGSMLDQKVKTPRVADDVAVDVTGFRRNGDSRMAAKQDPDETECSSSFADTTSGTENLSGHSDTEVESQFHEDGSFSAFDGFSNLFPMRKKKLTTHWRNFIRPVMWRCKWAELKIRELQSQAAKYSREIAACDQRKHAVLDQTIIEEYGSRSLPYSFQNHRQKLMKRRNRNKIEDTIDTTLYISNHCLFSFHENRKNDLDGASFGDDFSNPVSRNASGVDDSGNDFLEDNDNILEQTLRNIELTQARVHKMKTQLDIVMFEYAYKFSSSESLSLLPGDAQTLSNPSPTFSACNGDNVSVRGLPSPPYIQECDLGDFIIPDSMASSYGEAVLIPDIIESTAEFLSLTDVTQHHGIEGDSIEKIVDNINMPNGSVEIEGGFSLKAIKTEPSNNEELQDSDNSEEDESVGPLHPAIMESAKTDITLHQSTSISGLTSGIHIPKNKRKRGERKAGSVGWSRHDFDFDN